MANNGGDAVDRDNTRSGQRVGTIESSSIKLDCRGMGGRSRGSDRMKRRQRGVRVVVVVVVLFAAGVVAIVIVAAEVDGAVAAAMVDEC